MDELEKEMSSGFLEEASHFLSDTELCILSLTASPSDKSILEEVIRLARPLKVSLEAGGFDAATALALEFETLLVKILHDEVSQSTQSVTFLLRCNDRLKSMIESLTADLNAEVADPELISDIKGAQVGIFPPSIPPLESQSSPTLTTLETIPAPSSDSPSWDEELSPTLEALEETTFPVVNAETTDGKDVEIFISEADLERLLAVETLTQITAHESVSSLPSVAPAEASIPAESPKSVPIQMTFEKLQWIVRDTARTLGKKIDFHAVGEENELDPMILENLGDSLVHLVRNAADHGIESASTRIAKGKPENGNIRIGAYLQAGKFMIEVSDDGGGIDPKLLTEKAIEKGILKPGAALSEKDAIDLIFHPGFSTKTEITEISGRGIGMDIVKALVEKTQGEIRIQSTRGEGTRVQILLPLTASATIDGLVVESGAGRYVIPLKQVYECLKPEVLDFQRTLGVGEILQVRGENLPLYRFNDCFSDRIDNGTADCTDGIAVVVRACRKPFAVLVDAVIGPSPITLQPLGPEMSSLKEFRGSAILSDGRPSLVLELEEWVKKIPAKNQLNVVEGGSDRFVGFFLGEEEFAIPLASVREILNRPEVTPVPQSPKYLRGILNFKGQVISLIDLGEKLGIATGKTAKAEVIVCGIGSSSVGVFVDSVHPAFSARKSEITDTGMIRYGGRSIRVIDLEKSLDPQTQAFDSKRNPAA